MTGVRMSQNFLFNKSIRQVLLSHVQMIHLPVPKILASDNTSNSKVPQTILGSLSISEVAKMLKLLLRVYSSSQNHFSEFDVKVTEKNKFITHFVQKGLEMRENGQDVILNESLEALENHSEIVGILILAITTAGDGASKNDFVGEACFTLF